MILETPTHFPFPQQCWFDGRVYNNIAEGREGGGGGEERREEREIFQSVSRFLSKIVSLLRLPMIQFLIMSKIVALEPTTLWNVPRTIDRLKER